MSVPKEPEQVMKQRGGSVLGKKTILKSDHFPGCQNKRLAPQIDGAPNYRQANSLLVHGVAIPTTDGIQNVLNHIGAQKKGKQTRVLWHNLREEPVVYINGRPFVLRDVERPFSNLEYTGINRARVEQMEARLKDDILLEAARYGNKILVTDELPDGQMVDQWESVTHDSVKTPLEVYEELQVEGYLVDYERVPITDEKSPKEQDFDILCWEMAPRAIDVGWMYCTKINNNRLQTKCNFCDACHYGGGVTRHKQHLAGRYANVQKCTKCPLEISRKMQEHLARSRAKGNQREDDDERLTEELMEDIDEYRGSDVGPDDEDAEMVAAMRASREEARAHEWEMRHGMRRSQSYRPGEGSGSGTPSSRGKEKSERVEAFCRSASVKEMFDMFKDSGKGKMKSTDKGKKKKSPDIRDMADPATYRPRDASQRRIEESLKSHSLRARMGRAISRWFHSALIPAHKAKDPHFKAMVREIQRCGPNVTPPTPYEISGTYLDEVVVEVKEYIERFKEKWPEYGVTIMCDGWSGPTRLSIINFLVFCDGRTIFHKSINASAEIKDAAYLYRLMDEVVEEIGEENVVQIVTDNAANFKKAGLSLMQKRQHIYWTPCAAHCIDLIFKDIGEIKKIQDLVSDARRITNFIYNHSWVLALMRSHTLGDLVRPASTRFATNYVALSSLLERMDGLVQMFTSQEWFCSTYASSEPGRYVQDLVTSTRFWAKIRRVNGLMQPLFSILREVDGDKDQTMGILMDRMLRAMLTVLQLNTSESQKVAKIIDSRLGGMLLQDIHRAASYLNPTLQYQDARLGYDVEILDALRRVINRMEPDTIRAAAAVDEVHRILQTDINTEIVFNCQMGRGRTTTGMVIATLVYLNRIGASGIPRTNSIGKVFDAGSNVTDNLPNSEEAIRRGEYAVIRSLIRVLEGGVEGKRQVDKVIDRCASMQNLREAIATYRSSILRQPDEMKREASLSFFVEYLERYYFLICFAVYIHTERAALLSSASGQSSFAHWMRARPELYSILRRLLRRDPMGALGYSSLKPSLMKIAESADGRPYEMGVVAALRNGEVLGSQTVLKSDHCPGCQNLSLPERVEGAPNFREVPGFPVYGVANPTIDGIRAVVQRVGSSKGGRPVFWHNMREEPVVYINGKPFVLREVERPYKNMLEYTGIDRERVERMEARLKEDILRESERYGGAIMVIHETNDGQIFDAWEHVNCGSIKTPLEVYRCLEAEGLPIKYARVPITDGKAPKSSDFDTLALNIASATKDTAFVFNCQMGRGRTTTGTVIACLLRLRIDYGRPLRLQPLAAACEEVDSGSSSGEDAGVNSTASTSNMVKIKNKKEPNRTFGINDILLLREITRLFDNGVECREALDAIIDRCSALQNIRQAVLHYRKVFNQQHVEPRVRRVALNRGAEYLERYFRLIAFAAYIGSGAFDGFCGQGDSRMIYKTWLHQRPEVQAMKWSLRLRPGRFFTVHEELRAPHESQHGDAVMEAIVKDRNGSVLGKGSILKMYFFPGQRTSSRIQIHGAPHVYKVDRYPVYSMATPTVSGAREMLTYLCAKSTAGEKVAQKVIITDLREEAAVYINSTPFVLRELNQPVDTLKHVGITGSAVEHMETRLKEDILAEVTQSGGRMLLHREEHSTTLYQASVTGYWENILADNVKTPSEVYGALKDEGFNVEYRRIPLTREREALASDVDAIQYCKDKSAGCYLFVSHTGFGGVAYAMAIICLRLNAEGPFASETSEPLVGTQCLSSISKDKLQTWASDEEARKEGDYRDILNLTRVLMYGPKSKAEVDLVIERCAGAGNLRDDILYYRQELEKCTDCDDEKRACVMDMGIKALRRYFFLITFRSYLYCTSPSEMGFLDWIKARPELGHLCHNLRIDK